MSKSELIDINQTALDWWEGLSEKEQWSVSIKYYEEIDPYVHPKYLKQGQILSIYNKEVGDGQDVPKEKSKGLARRDWEIVGEYGSNKSVCEVTGNFMSSEEKEETMQLLLSAPQLKRDNDILLEALNKISKYNGDGLTDKAIAINVITIADIALFKTMGNTIKEKSHE